MQKHQNARCGLVLILLLSLFFLDSSAVTLNISAIAENHELSPGDYALINISSMPDSDIYYAEMDISYDNAVLEFISVTNGQLMQEGLVIGGDLAVGLAGVSVSRTSPLSEPGSGIIMILSFKVKDDAGAGNTEVAFTRLLVLDSEAEPVNSEPPPAVLFEVKAGISSLLLLIPAVNTINEGESFTAGAAAFAPGVDDGHRIAVHIGLSGIDSDPSGWGDEVWIEMDFEGADQQNVLQYSAEVAFMLPSGEWFLAVRASLDGGDYVYGGPEGILPPAEGQLALLNILPRPAFRYSLANWNFSRESLFPAAAIAENQGSELRIAGASITGFLTGHSHLAVNSSNWSNKQDGPCYWWVEISTAGFESLEVSSRQYGSNTGPRDFRLEYSLDGFEWIPVEGGGITVGNNWTNGFLDRLPLPTVLEDRQSIRLRWIITSDISINETITGPTGTNRLDNIIITGVNPYTEYVTVFPGDANNDGMVNADDVLPLGLYWMHTGPPAVWPCNGFSPRSIEQWIPAGATFADTNGDGVVDHRDLLAVGMNFGSAAGTEKKASGSHLAAIEIDPGNGETLMNILIGGEPGTQISGVAFRIEIEGIPEEMWEPGKIIPLFAEGHREEDMISFVRRVDNGFEAALVLKGMVGDRLPEKLVEIELVADDNITEPFSVFLKRLTVSSSNSPGYGLKEGSLALTDRITGFRNLPSRDNMLLTINPNPFSTVLDICFGLEAASQVKLDITCMQGRVVAAIFNDFLYQGDHRIMFDGSFLSPGLYLCRLTLDKRDSESIRIIKIR